VNELEKQIHWLRSCIEQRSVQQPQMPDWVPSRIRLDTDIRSEIHGYRSSFVLAGNHDCTCNRWGAVTVDAADGKPLGIRPHECHVLAMKPNSLKAIYEREQAERAARASDADPASCTESESRP
jgi:hypothetical protein